MELTLKRLPSSGGIGSSPSSAVGVPGTEGSGEFGEFDRGGCGNACSGRVPEPYEGVCVPLPETPLSPVIVKPCSPGVEGRIGVCRPLTSRNELTELDLLSGRDFVRRFLPVLDACPGP